MKEVDELKRWLALIALLLPIVAACGTPPADQSAAEEEEAATQAEEEAAEEQDDEEEADDASDDEEADEEEADDASDDEEADEEADETDDASDDEDTAEYEPMEVDESQLSDELYFYNWSEYIDPALLDEFEEEYGVRVIEDVYDANESMLPKIRAGNSGYDIVVPSDYAVEILLEEDLAAPLDKEMLPNLEYIDPDLMGLYYDPDNEYSVPYFWGTTGIGYNQTFFDTPPDSWAMLFEEENLEEIDGRFTMLEDPRETPGAALIYMGESINTTDEEALQQAEELLLEQKPYLAAYDSANVNLKLATEEVVIAHIYDGSVAQAIAGFEDKPGNPDISYLIPDEGATIWQDNLVIVGDSPNTYTAHVFINFLLRPDIAARNADWVFYLTPNEAARSLLAEETRDLFELIEPKEADMDRLQWIERSEETDRLYNNLWTRVVSQ
jgi:spermidine/putrescine transport system substrate-binding protein